MELGITGHKGFLGKHLMDRLGKNKKISKVDGFDLPENDIFDSSAVEKFVKGKDVIVHLAALNRADDLELMRVNLLGTFSLVNAVKKVNPGCRLVFSSSFQVYSKSSNTDIIDENFPAIPFTVYGFSKRFGEDLICHALDNYAILRISNIYGPGCRPFYNSVVATFVQLAKEGKELTITGSGEQSRDFIFIDDVIDAFEAAVFSKEKGIFNICSGTAVSMNLLTDSIKKHFKSLKIVKKPSDEEIITVRGSCEKAKKSLKWSPKTDFGEGLKSCVGA